MSFRVLSAGGRHSPDYPTLRAALDVLLANRLPDVVPLTAGGLVTAALHELANGAEGISLGQKARLARLRAGSGQ